MDFVVLSSSRGTTFQAVLDAIKDGSLHARCLGLITDKPDRGCIDKARAAGLPFVVVEKQKEETREAYDQRLNDAIIELEQKLPACPEPGRRAARCTLIAALGWMFIFSKPFIEKWKNRIINVHPALLPKFGGKGMYGIKVHEAVLASGDTESGITIHLMDDGVDTGPILVQKKCSIGEGETAEGLRDKVQALEKEWYPRVLEMIEEGEVELPA